MNDTMYFASYKLPYIIQPSLLGLAYRAKPELGGHGPRRSSWTAWKLGMTNRACGIRLCDVFGLRESSLVCNAAFSEEDFRKNHEFYAHISYRSTHHSW